MVGRHIERLARLETAQPGGGVDPEDDKVYKAIMARIQAREAAGVTAEPMTPEQHARVVEVANSGLDSVYVRILKRWLEC